jgi:hypothetical protein
MNRPLSSVVMRTARRAGGEEELKMGLRLTLVIAAFVMGFVVSAATRKRIDTPRPLPRVAHEAESSPDRTDLPRATRTVPSSILPRFLDNDPADYTDLHHALARYLEILPRAAVQSALYSIVWDHPEMERKAFDLMRRSKSPGDVRLFAEMWILGHISDPSVRSELASWIRSESNPRLREHLARIVGSNYHAELLPVTLELLSDPDPHVVQATLKQLDLGRKPFQQNKELKADVARKLRDLAAEGHPVAMRTAAVRSLRDANDPETARMLVDILARDREPDLLEAAMRSLPDVYDFDPEHSVLAVRMIRTLYSIAVDPSRPRGVRQSAVSAILNCDGGGDYAVLSPVEKTQVEVLQSELTDP